ncbi:Sulfite reductase [ferredoxin] [Pseudovibrio axinellae]|uniref:Sulfite reductase [ferredoxin] n=1 Tax=Pseudovibrio axinellae TaxID=989403 RepID=A0A165U2C4_9HYPH|nr:nitrite/sulfite reductase [Pseudovibrio axinellae]KZL09485.1 Sulfite reductase [ferredoxin] [Pseudovibrio axinellae]SEQ63366.1 sulfite reductase (NADPH) hemoprotein beta-component [Pseudovibrio axinellae]
MYRYDEFDQDFVDQRVTQFEDQVRRRMTGELTEEEFKPLRLMNGLYLQLHAYMLRVAIPYGTINARQMRKLADIARTYDRGYGHFTTRQNIQFNWPKLSDTPKILRELADVEMHAIQTSGNCIRNVTSDQFAGAAADEFADPRVYAEILRQWSSLHPEFLFLPRKFKIAITGAEQDRAAVQVHDIGLQLTQNEDGDIGFVVFVGGGLGRTPMVGRKVRDFLPENDLLAYSEAILRVYNRYGRRDNKYKARIKILVHETGLEELKQDIETEFEATKNGILDLPHNEIERINEYFAPPSFEVLPSISTELESAKRDNRDLALFASRNLHAHKAAGYTSVTISLKPIGGAPGDATAEQMDVIADLAERFGHDELRVTHEQNLVLPHVKLKDVPLIFKVLKANDLADANAGLITDMIACPGLDYCALANARSIPIAQEISKRFEEVKRKNEIGDLKLKISGCINACGHHHVGHIGILGVDRKGEELYQITLGGSADQNTSIGKIIGRGFPEAEITDAVEIVVDTYLVNRLDSEESFIEAYRRLGDQPFKDALYGA